MFTNSFQSDDEATTEEEDWGPQTPVSPRTATLRHLYLEDWPGMYEFTLSYDEQRLETTHDKTAFLKKALEKLFMVPNTLVKLKFKVKKEILMATNDFFVRAVPYFILPSKASKPVNVCKKHSVTNIGKPMRSHHEHLVLTSEIGARYNTDAESQRQSVLIPVNPQLSQDGSGELTIRIKFADRPECNKFIGTLFTLETPSAILGRAKVRIRLTFHPEKISQIECDYQKRQQ